MRKTTEFNDFAPKSKGLVDSKGLQAMLSCGMSTAVRIGTEAKAKVKIGRRVLWNVDKVQEYINKISE